MPSYFWLNINNHFLIYPVVWKHKSTGVVLDFPRDNISVQWWRNPNGDASIAMNIWPGLTAHRLSCHSYPVEVEDNLWSCVEMSKQVKGYLPRFVHPGGVFLWKPASVRWKVSWLNTTNVFWLWRGVSLSRAFPRPLCQGVSIRRSGHRQSLLSIVWKSGISAACWAEHSKTPFIIGLWCSGSVTRTPNCRWATLYWEYPGDSNSGRVTAVSQNFWGGVWGVAWPPIIDLLIRQEESRYPPQLNDKRNVSYWFSLLVLFSSLDHGYSEYPQAVMYVCSQGYCHLINRMRRDIKHDNMSLWNNLKISCFRTSCKVIIHFR